jgi:HlyD family secretion protein
MSKIKELVKSKRKIFILSALILLSLSSIFIFNGFQTTAKTKTIVTTKDGTFIEASGVVENNPINLSSEISGVITNVMVKEGDLVKRGQIIAEVDNSSIKNQYEQALDNLDVAKKNIEVSQKSIKSYQNVYSDSKNQAKSAYNFANDEYQNVLEGASTDEVKQAQEAYNQALINLKYMENNLNASNTLLTSGKITQMNYDEIKKNYNLAVSQVNTASAKLDQVKTGPSSANVKAAKDKMSQAKAAYELSVSNGDMQLKQLENQYEMAKLKYDQAQTIVNQLKKELSKTEIKSPTDGIINLLTINKGEFTPLGKPVAEISGTNDMEIKVYVSEANIGHIKVGQEANIHIDSTSEETFKGKVIRISSNAEFTPKNIQTKEERVNTVFEVRLQILDSKGVIKPGMPVDVNIKIN